MTKKYSKQRDAIITEVKSRKDHPTADEVYSSLREEYPNISLGTVYRNLSDLAKAGEILRLNDCTGPDRFDGNSNCHYHFQCTSCFSVMDVEMGIAAELNNMAEEALNAEIEGHTLLFYGTCNNCIK